MSRCSYQSYRSCHYNYVLFDSGHIDKGKVAPIVHWSKPQFLLDFGHFKNNASDQVQSLLSSFFGLWCDLITWRMIILFCTLCSLVGAAVMGDSLLSI